MPRAPGERHSGPPVSMDDRTTERRLVPSVPAHVPPPAESTRDVAQEDFLFHLYRGSELLQENRVHEAKEELEFALTMQPLDSKGQDLLGAVYFRLGLYPRAIQIYENLESQFARETSIKVNLALCYLKTGQPEPARRALADVVRINPNHKRAWGYLGLALQKLGDLDQAQIAFERGGQAMMATRVREKKARMTMPITTSIMPSLEEGLREVAETAFSELDAGELRFALAMPEAPGPAEGQWHAIEPGDAATADKGKSPFSKTLPPPSVRTHPSSSPNSSLAALGSSVRTQSAHESATVPPPVHATAEAHAAHAPNSKSTRLVPPPPAADALAESPREPEPAPVPASLLELPEGQAIVARSPAIVVARAGEDNGALATRLEALRVVSGTAATRVLHRRSRDAETHEVLGGLGSPMVRVSGDATVVLGARPGHDLALVALDDELLFVREDLLLAFESRVAHENGRVALDEGGEPVALVQLRGTGSVVLELPHALERMACAEGRALLVRREWVVGWLGRLVARALPSAESPGGQRGLVAFSGDGAVLVTTRR